MLCDLANYENQVIFISVDLKNMFGAVAEDITLILSGMKTYESNADEQEYNCRTLWKLAMNDNNRVTVAAEGGITTILSAMKFHLDNANVQKHGCRALCNLANNNDHNQLRISNVGGKVAIESAMQKHSSNAGVQENGNETLSIMTQRGKWWSSFNLFSGMT